MAQLFSLGGSSLEHLTTIFMFEPERMKFALEAMSKAGWIDSANIAESASHTRVGVTPTQAGAERLQALFILLSELDQPSGRLNDDELGLYCWRGRMRRVLILRLADALPPIHPSAGRRHDFPSSIALLNF